MTLEWIDHDLSICRLNADAPCPDWALASAFMSITRTDAELSVVVESSAVPADAGERARLRVEGPWRAFRVAGQLPFGLVGVVVSLTRPLAEAGIPVFVISTFDTDYVMVKAERVSGARAAVASAGHVWASG